MERSNSYSCTFQSLGKINCRMRGPTQLFKGQADEDQGFRRRIRASSRTTMRMHPLPPLKASTSRKPANYPRRMAISIDRPAFLRPAQMGFLALIPVAARQIDALFPYLPGLFPYLPGVARSVFSPVPPKQFPAVGHLGI